MSFDIHRLENHELSELRTRMSSSGHKQVLCTIYRPEAAELIEALLATPVTDDVAEWWMLGLEAKNKIVSQACDLLPVIERTRMFDGYQEARDSCKRALRTLPVLKSWIATAQSTPGTVEFDVEFFFADFMPWRYRRALIEHQGTIADAAGRGDLRFFKRLNDRVKNAHKAKAGGFYRHFLATSWLDGLFWLMPEKVACGVVADRLESVFKAADEQAGLVGRKNKLERKLTHSSVETHEAQRTRFREAVKSLGLFQHPEAPLIEVRPPIEGAHNSTCYVWKDGWPK